MAAVKVRWNLNALFETLILELLAKLVSDNNEGILV